MLNDLEMIKRVLMAVLKIFKTLEKKYPDSSWWWLTEQMDVETLLSNWSEIESRAMEEKHG